MRDPVGRGGEAPTVSLSSQAGMSGPPPLAVARQLVERLDEAGIRYGVYKNRDAVAAGLAGLGDIDLLVAVGDSARFEAVLASLDAVRADPHPWHDTRVEGRSQWFVPDPASGAYLHLDVVAGLRIGHRFAKRYRALDHDDVLEWDRAEAPLPPLPILSLRDEGRLALLRSLYALPTWSRRRWVRVDGECARLLRRAALIGSANEVVRFDLGKTVVLCRVREAPPNVEVERRGIVQLMALVRRHDGHGWWREQGDLVVHHARRLRDLGARALSEAGLLESPRKAVLPAGLVIALIGPDGVGKSTQVARLAAILGRKFRCTTVYLGSGDGGWLIRRMARRGLAGWWARRRSLAYGEGAGGNAFLSASWGMLTAIERLMACRRARRASARGAIVISDRWPQVLQPGLLDGPRNMPQRPGLALGLWRIEQALYRRMAAYRPDQVIHLVSDFETSSARKPGDIDRPAFERRVKLMEAMRARDPATAVVDARDSLDEVTRNLFRIAWQAVRRAQGGEPARIEQGRPRLDGCEYA